MRHIPCLLACLCVGIFAHLAPAEEPKIIEPTPEQLKEATETLAKAGVGYYPDGGLDPRLKVDRPPRYLGQPIPVFEPYVNWDVTKVPNVPFSFALNLRRLSPGYDPRYQRLKDLSRLTNLVALDLAGPRISDQELEALKDLKQIRCLVLSSTDVTDQRIKAIAQLTNLEVLDLNFTKVTDEGVKDLKQLKKLAVLGLSYNITDKGLNDVKELKELTSLGLTGTKITDEGVAHLAELKKLKILTLRQTKITDAGIAHLKQLGQLEVLDLSGTAVTDAGLKQLGGLKIRKLGVPKFTNSTIAALHEIHLLHAVLIGQARNEKGHYMPGWPPSKPDEVKGLGFYHNTQGRAPIGNLQGGALVGNFFFETIPHPDQTFWMPTVPDVVDDTLKELAEFEQLTWLSVNGWHITDAGLANLKGLRNLASLDLGGTQVKDLTGLREIKNLTAVSLNGCAVTDVGLKELGELKNFTSLSLSNPKIADSAAKELKEVKQLTTLDLTGCTISDDGVKHLKELTKLKKLALSGKGITDSAVNDLKQFRNLKELVLLDTAVTEKGETELKKTIPNCIFWNPPR